jgi:acetyltransferase-like isoleucine patch superfamily enzyme
MKNRFLLLYAWVIRTGLFFFPDIPIFMRFRGFMYALGMKSCGIDFQVAHDVVIKGLQNIDAGNNIFVGNHSVIMGGGEIFIGNEVLIGPHVVIISGNHTKIENSYRFGKANIGSIFLGAGSWITSNCTVSINSSLPSGSVLSANSFLNKKFKITNAIYGGVPAKMIKND